MGRIDQAGQKTRDGGQVGQPTTAGRCAFPPGRPGEHSITRSHDGAGGFLCIHCVPAQRCRIDELEIGLLTDPKADQSRQRGVPRVGTTRLASTKLDSAGSRERRSPSSTSRGIVTCGAPRNYRLIAVRTRLAAPGPPLFIDGSGHEVDCDLREARGALEQLSIGSSSHRCSLAME